MMRLERCREQLPWIVLEDGLLMRVVDGSVYLIEMLFAIETLISMKMWLEEA
jgi:hypothetical protein